MTVSRKTRHHIQRVSKEEVVEDGVCRTYLGTAQMCFSTIKQKESLNQQDLMIVLFFLYENFLVCNGFTYVHGNSTSMSIPIQSDN